MCFAQVVVDDLRALAEAYGLQSELDLRPPPERPAQGVGAAASRAARL